MAFLCVDVGTSACKAALVNKDGKITTLRKTPHSFTVEGNRGEADPEEVWDTLAVTVKGLLEGGTSGSVEGVGVSTVLGYVFLDADARPLRPAILYLDRRSGTPPRLSHGRDQGAFRFSRTGRRLTPELLAPKLFWLRDKEPDVFSKVRRIVGLKDYLVYKLTGELGTDPAHGNYTFLFDVEKGIWDKELMDWVGIDAEVFPPCTYPYQVAGTVKEAAFRDTAIPPGTPVVRGSTDGTTAMYGAGVAEQGVATLVTGSTDVCMVLSERLLEDPELRLSQNTGMVPGTYAVGGATGLSGGALLRWKELFSLNLEERMPSLPQIPPGSDGLLVFPGFTGERSPYWLSNGAGAIWGWKVEHTLSHFLRAWAEGTAYRIRRVLQTLDEGGIPMQSLNLTGGGAVWDPVNQVRADVWGLPVRLTQELEGTLLGTALFAAIGVGTFSDLREGSARWVRIIKEYHPDREKTELYAALMKGYEQRLFQLFESRQ